MEYIDEKIVEINDSTASTVSDLLSNYATLGSIDALDAKFDNYVLKSEIPTPFTPIYKVDVFDCSPNCSIDSTMSIIGKFVHIDMVITILTEQEMASNIELAILKTENPTPLQTVIGIIQFGMSQTSNGSVPIPFAFGTNRKISMDTRGKVAIEANKVLYGSISYNS
jgi:hypothetical protein